AASVDPKSSREITYASDYDTTLLKAFVTYSKDLDDDSNLMFNTYRFTDKKTYQSAYEDVDGDGFNEAHDYANDEKWAQNGLKSEYRTTINSTAIMAGIDIQRNKDKSIAEVLPWGTGSYGPLSDSSIDTDENIDALYLELKQQLSTKLTGTFNIRYDDIEYKLNDNYDSTNNVNPSYDETSYRAGVNYTLNENNSLYTSISTGFRAPTAGQISSNSEDGYTTDIDSEKTYNYEIGIKGLISNFNYEASIYQLDRKDYIGTTSGNYVRSSDEDIYYDNVANMRSRGLELSLNSDKKKDLSFNLAYTYLDAQYTKYNYKQLVVDNGFPTPDVFQTLDLSGNQVPRTSKHTLNLIVDFKTTSALTISPEVIAKSSYYADDTNKFKQSGYALVNLRANYKIDKSLEFFAKIDNLLDKDYYQFVNVTASTVDKNMDDSTIIVGPTRSFYAGLRYKF
ncbi:MAG: TonB-dependent receptor, partial [Campylobacterota bacterium]|nr:TonB-dependent receptor [Campylobacterota bacterium]